MLRAAVRSSVNVAVPGGTDKSTKGDEVTPSFPHRRRKVVSRAAPCGQLAPLRHTLRKTLCTTRVTTPSVTGSEKSLDEAVPEGNDADNV